MLTEFSERVSNSGRFRVGIRTETFPVTPDILCR